MLNVMQATDKAYGDDEAENVSFLSIGACGAFVHGIEDEYQGRLSVTTWQVIVCSDTSA